MIAQYMIDWDGVLESRESNPDALARDLMRLEAWIRRNGCVIVTDHIRRTLQSRIDRLAQSGPVEVGLVRVLMHFQIGMEDRLLDIDEAMGRSSGNLSESCSTWERYLKKAGDYFWKGDDRCLLLTKECNAQGKGPCFRRLALEQVWNGGARAYRWARLQCVSPANLYAFREYLQSFSATLDLKGGSIRIYDPYLFNAFRSFREKDAVARNVKRWRNSLRYVLDVLLRNEFVRTVELFTRLPREVEKDNEYRLLLAEGVDDILALPSSREGMLEVCLHFLKEDSGQQKFHDRFISNGRYCFSIGHGFDVLTPGEDFDTWLKRRRGEDDVPGAEARCIPRAPVANSFNVFYGGARSDLQSSSTGSLCVFGEGNVHRAGLSRAYPEGWYARRFDDIKGLFDFGGHRDRNPVYFPNEQAPRLKVSINPLTKVDDFSGEGEGGGRGVTYPGGTRPRLSVGSLEAVVAGAAM